jgi:putative phosphonate metabolism protein
MSSPKPSIDQRQKFDRYAVYFSPPKETPIQQFAGHWFGRDTMTGEKRSRLALKGFSPEGLAAITASPARYGFHATLKAPFRLSAEADYGDLLQSARKLATQLEPVTPLRLEMGELSGFLALRPDREEDRIGAVADACTTELDRYRATLNKQERARRLNGALTDRQVQHLDRWGYPYVLDDFRFHMTLTKRLDDPLRSRLFDALAPHVADALATPFDLDSLCLFGDPGDGRPFQFLDRIPFAMAAV